MTAWTIFSEAFRFYGRLFNKIFWLSVAYSLAPFILGGALIGAGQSSGSALIMLFGMLIMMLTVCFFYTYQITLIDQFSEQGNDSLRDALPRAANRTIPFFGSAMALGLTAFVVMILSGIAFGIVAGVLGLDTSGLQADEKASLSLQDVVLVLLVLAPVIWLMYRLIFVPFYVIADSAGVREAFTLSNQHVRKNKLVFWGLTLVGIFMLIYTLLIMAAQFMMSLNPMAMAFLQFALNIVVTPYFAVYFYRLFKVSKPVASEQPVAQVMDEATSEKQAENSTAEENPDSDDSVKPSEQDERRD